MSEEAYRDALGRALRRLETSDRYESEVRAALRRFEAPVVDRVVAYLREHRMLNDARTTSHAVDMNVGRRAVGDALLADRLVARGADQQAVATALAEGESEADRIDELLKAKYRPTDPPAKAGRFLYGRGFSEEAIETALAKYFVNGGDEA